MNLPIENDIQQKVTSDIEPKKQTVESETGLKPLDHNESTEQTDFKSDEHQNDISKDSLLDEDIIQALHTIENDHIDQSITLQNDIKSVLSTLQTLTEKVEVIEYRVQTVCNSGIDKRLKTLEEKVDVLISQRSSETFITTTQQEKIDNKPDCASFIETIIELTSKISGLEHKFEILEEDILEKLSSTQEKTHDTSINSIDKTKNEQEVKDKLQINVETSNKFEALVNLEDNTIQYNTIQTGNTQSNEEKTVNTTDKHDKICVERSSILHADEENEITPDKDESKQLHVHVGRVNNYEHEVDLWIIGSSITRNINPKLMYRNKLVRVTTLKDKTVNGAKNYIGTGKVQAKNLLLQIGSNDLNKKSPNEVLHEIEDLFNKCQSCIPGADIVIGEILPRFQNSLDWRHTYEAKRREINAGLKQISIQYNCSVTRSPYIKEEDVVDGIHLSVESGVPKLISAYKQVTNKLLGMKEHNNSRNYNPKYNSSSSVHNTQYEPSSFQNEARPSYDQYSLRTYNNMYNYHGKRLQDEPYYKTDNQRRDELYNSEQTRYNQLDRSNMYANNDQSAQEKLKYLLTVLMKDL